MSWAEEDWTVGLSGRVLQKVKELQVQKERLSKESKQRQLQLDNSQDTLSKQTLKYEEVRGTLQVAQRELQGVREEAQVGVSARERLSQDLQTKQAQVCSLEGQLDSARALTHHLTQQVKRLEAEVEKLQSSSRLGDSILFSTPCWSMTSPWEHTGGRKEERPGHRGEGGESRTPHGRQQLQFSDTPTASSLRQQHKSTPHRHPPDQSGAFSSPVAVFPWERDDSRPAARGRPPPSPQTPSTVVISRGQPEQWDGGKAEDLRRETDTSDTPPACVSELRRRVCTLEEELCAEAKRLKGTQEELAARELHLQKTRDQLSLAHTHMSQESERASGAEQRLRQLQEELKCQRQNAESGRLQHQQRTRELEKLHQRDLSELQKERQFVAKQHQQEVNKLNQELQQSRTLHNALQAQAHKVSVQKQALDRELEALKEKLKWTEGQLQESQKKDAQTQAKLTEALHEAEGVAASLEQSRRREKASEEEGRRLAEECAHALHLLKELQEQKAAPAAPLPSVQFCPPHPYSSHHPRPSAHTKRPIATTRGEDIGGQIRAKYPTDREPGEGIDSEHITAYVSPESEHSEGRGERGKMEEEERKSRNEGDDAMGCDSSGTEKDSALSLCSQSTADTPTNASIDSDHHTSPEKTAPLCSQPHEELRKENAALHSEIHDVREELQKRLEDLEAQRRAETEARTRLKQLSRKHASQSAERVEQDRERKAELERERAETERLRKALAAMEVEVNREREEREEKERGEDGKERALEDRESEMRELNIQLKKQLAEVKAQLALEWEEREREKEEEERKKKELEAELEELKSRRKKHSLEEKELPEGNSPLTYLTLHDDNKLLPSPEQHHLLCQSTNQRNTAVSQATGDLIQEDAQAGRVASDLEGIPLENNLGESYLSDQREAPTDLQTGVSATSDLAKEVERLREKNVRETGRANQCRAKLEALQSQVTRQTQHLTMAFDRQSQHITGLLAELQEKESALLCQGEELQRCKQELASLRAQKEEEEENQRRKRMTTKEVRDEEQAEERQNEKPAVEISALQLIHENEFTNILLTASTLSGAASTLLKDAGQPDALPATGEPEEQTSDREALRSVAWPQRSAGWDKPGNHGNHHAAGVKETSLPAATSDYGQGGGMADNSQQRAQKADALTISDTTGSGRDPALRAARENPEDSVQQSTNPAKESTSCPTAALTDIMLERRQIGERGENEEDGAREEKKTGAEDESGISLLQQQVVALQAELQSLSEESQRQAEELALWRLASQPAPTLDQNLPQTDQTSNQQPTDDVYRMLSGAQTTAADQAPTLGPEEPAPWGVAQSPCTDQAPTLGPEEPAPWGVAQSPCTDQAPTLGPEEPAPWGVAQSPCTVTVIREDELLLSCSSNRLHGRMLVSRLQQSNFSEPKSLQPPKKSSAPQDYIQDTVVDDQESEKENVEISSSKQHKEKREVDLIQMSSDESRQQHVTKDPHKVSGLQTKATKLHKEDLEHKPNAPRAIQGSLGREARGKMRSTSTQTEEGLNPPSELQHTYTQTEEEEEEEDEEVVDSPPISPVPATESGDRMLFSGSFPIPSDPARLAERIRRNRSQLSAAFDDTEYEPYGLPEVVMKGFADIPSGPSCPYIVRRALLGTSAVPLPQKAPVPREETD